jgi:hypothetical protein
MDPRVLALVTLVPQAVTVIVAVLALRPHTLQPDARTAKDVPLFRESAQNIRAGAQEDAAFGRKPP